MCEVWGAVGAGAVRGRGVAGSPLAHQENGRRKYKKGRQTRQTVEPVVQEPLAAVGCSREYSWHQPIIPAPRAQGPVGIVSVEETHGLLEDPI